MARTGSNAVPLFAAGGTGKGRVEQAVNKSIRQAKADESLGLLDEGMCGVARALARGVDLAETGGDVFALAQAARDLRDVLARLGLDPSGRGSNDGDSLAWWVQELGRAHLESEPAPEPAPAPAPVEPDHVAATS